MLNALTFSKLAKIIVMAIHYEEASKEQGNWDSPERDAFKHHIDALTDKEKAELQAVLWLGRNGGSGADFFHMAERAASVWAGAEGFLNEDDLVISLISGEKKLERAAKG